MCKLCNLVKKANCYYEDEHMVICDCSACKIPHAVLKKHTMETTTFLEMRMITKLNEFGRKFYGHDKFRIDTTQCEISNHLHWHARLK